MHGALMRDEIGEQPEIFERILSEERGAIHTVARQSRGASPRFVLFVPHGTSDHAALYAKYPVETQLGLPAGLAVDGHDIWGAAQLLVVTGSAS